MAHALPTRKTRDAIKEVLPDCLFILLTLSKESQKKRIINRHGEGEEAEGMIQFAAGIFEFYEKPGDGEKGTFNLDIDEDMTKEDVMNKVLEIVNDN